MDWNAVSAIAEWVGIVFIVVSLIYVARQIHQNTEMVRAATELETGRMWSELHAQVAHSPDIVDIWDKGHTNPDELNPTEKRRFIWFVAEYFFMVENMFRQRQSGFLGEASWMQHRQAIAGLLLNPLLARWWVTGVSPFSNEFVANINQAREEIGPDVVWSYTPIADI